MVSGQALRLIVLSKKSRKTPKKPLRTPPDLVAYCIKSSSLPVVVNAMKVDCQSGIDSEVKKFEELSGVMSISSIYGLTRFFSIQWCLFPVDFTGGRGP